MMEVLIAIARGGNVIYKFEQKQKNERYRPAAKFKMPQTKISKE